MTAVPLTATAFGAIAWILPAASGVPLTRSGSQRAARRHRSPRVTP